MTDRDPDWYRRLLGWLEGALTRGRVERLALKRYPLKVLRLHDAPEPGHTTWCTFEHSDRRWQGPDVEVGYELCFSSRGAVAGLAVLRRAVESLEAVQRPPQPGSVLVDLLDGVEGLDPALRHAIVTLPWAFDAPPLHEGGRRVELLALVPATKAEIELVRLRGLQALEQAWTQVDAQLLDPQRTSS